MRITQALKYSMYMDDITRRQQAIYDAHNKLSTGKEVVLPSDDPVASAGILKARTALKEVEQYTRNIEGSLGYLDTAENAIANTKDVLIKIQEVAVGQATETASSHSRSQAGNMVSELFDELVSLGNTTYDGKYVFSGYETETAAFDPAGAYNGDTNRRAIKVGPGETMTVGMNGGEIFKGTGGGVDVYQSVADLITALNSDDTAGIQKAVGDLEDSFKQLSNHQSEIGGKVVRLNTARDILTNTKFNTESTLSRLEDADLTEVISDLRLSQAALEAVITSSGKVFDANIFNYI